MYGDDEGERLYLERLIGQLDRRTTGRDAIFFEIYKLARQRLDELYEKLNTSNTTPEVCA